AYVANWNQMLTGPGYFAALRTPSPLLHTWSLGIEEQFYLLWPLVVYGITRTRRPLRNLAGLSLAGAAASAVAMAALYDRGAGINRVYYGTDTRAQALLVGAALAALVAWRRPAALPGHRGAVAAGSPDGPMRAAGPVASYTGGPEDAPPGGRAARAALVVAGGAGAGLVAWCITSASSSSGWLYDGGFAAVALATAALIACVTLVPASPWSALLSPGPVRYVGRISYGLYLWHWPVFLVLDHQRTGLDGAYLFGARLAASLAVAAASFHLLEAPIRRGLLGPAVARLVTPAAVTGTAAVLVATTASSAASLAPPPASAAGEAGRAAAGAPGLDLSDRAVAPSVAAGTGGPLRVLLVGDSEASFMGFGLGYHDDRYGISYAGDGVIGCGLVLQGPTRLRGTVESGAYGIRGHDDNVLCSTQPVRWKADVDAFHPDVVVLEEGQFEVRDRRLSGRWTHIGEPAFDRLVVSAMDDAVAVLSSTGARVVMLTAPYYRQPERADGTPWPEDDPGRVLAYNRLVEAEAGRHPGVVTVEDLWSRLDPGGRYTDVLDGRTARFSDGIHVTPAGARYVADWLLPRLADIARQVREGRSASDAGQAGAPAPGPP
ncbi:MAG TPA: acyltransferase family protein, partial [Acidimicrobiales bacterium]|nr:acyltransferase family protein [Acidimicrobiales bacterium]